MCRGHRSVLNLPYVVLLRFVLALSYLFLSLKMFPLEGQDFKFSVNMLITCLFFKALAVAMQDVLLLITDDIFIFGQISQRDCVPLLRESYQFVLERELYVVKVLFLASV